MSALFRRKNPEGSTVLVLDVENGSVASSLVRLSPKDAPRLFGEKRMHIPLVKTHTPGVISKEVTDAVQKVLDHAMSVAARVRTHSSQSLGTIAHTAVFFSPPWATLNLGQDMLPHPMTQKVYEPLTVALGPGASISYHPFATATAHTVPAIYPHEESYLLCLVSGEIMEIVALQRFPGQSQVIGHATLPFGRNSLLRTLGTHGGLTPAEAESALKLLKHGHFPHHEPLSALANQIGEEFESVGQELAAAGTLRSIFVVAHEPIAEWFAQSLSARSLDSLFPEGGTVRAVRGSHISPYIAVHAHKPDIALLLEALYIDARLGKAGLAVIR